METVDNIGARDVEDLRAPFEFDSAEVVAMEIHGVEPRAGATVEHNDTGRDRVEVVTHVDRSRLRMRSALGWSVRCTGVPPSRRHDHSSAA